MNMFERAKKHSDRFNMENKAHEVSYIDGANEQQLIDMENAWEWIKQTCSKRSIVKEDLPSLKPSFDLAMDRIRAKNYFLQDIVYHLQGIIEDNGCTSSSIELVLEEGYTCRISLEPTNIAAEGELSKALE